MADDRFSIDLSRRRRASRRPAFRRAGPPTDLNLAIALAQLSLALEAPTFDEIWGARLSSRCEE
jgi:hypothetical protein